MTVSTETLDMTYEDTWATRTKVLDRLGMSYQEFLLSDYWLQVKNKALRNPTYTSCIICGCKDNLHLHHTSYKWLGTKDELRSVIPVCKSHHKQIHDISKETQISVRIVSNYMRNPDSAETIKQLKTLGEDKIDLLKTLYK